ncbi:carbohydrate kinase family protein [bacterium]|nr:carbohydrate kinase family protein [bacterium]
MKVAVTGSIAYDYLMSFPGNFSEHFIPEKLDSISVSFLVDSLKKRRGGTAANIAYSLALLGESPLLVGVAGLDFPDYGAALKDAGVDLSGVKIITSEYTPSFFASTDNNGNQIAFFAQGAMRAASEVSLKEMNLEPGTIVIISPNDPKAMQMYVEECKELGLKYIYDPGQQIVRLEKDALINGADGANILILNDYELSMFLKKTGLDKNELSGLAETLIVTLGGKGSEIIAKGETIKIPTAPLTNIADPTGVGDAFRAGLLTGLLSHFSWETAGRMGSLAAVYVLEQDGPQNHSYTKDEFFKRFLYAFPDFQEVKEIL